MASNCCAVQPLKDDHLAGDYHPVLVTTDEDFAATLQETDWVTNSWTNKLGHFLQLDPELYHDDEDVVTRIIDDLGCPPPDNCNIVFTFQQQQEDASRIVLIRYIPALLLPEDVLGALEDSGLTVVTWETRAQDNRMDEFFHQPHAKISPMYDLLAHVQGTAEEINVRSLFCLGLELQVQDFSFPLPEEQPAPARCATKEVACCTEPLPPPEVASPPTPEPMTPPSSPPDVRPRVQPTTDQCFRCQQWGHRSNTCTHPPRCRLCAGHHLVSSCPDRNKRCCSVCSGHHAASSRSCPLRPKPWPDTPSPRRLLHPLSPDLRTELRKIITSTINAALKNRARRPG